MTSKKVAYVATVYSHLANFHIPFMHMLQAQGYEVHAYANPDHCKAEVERAGIVCHDIPFSRSPLSFDNVRALKRLTGAFKEHRYDMIHVHTPNASAVTRVAARIAGCRNVIYTAHGFHFYKGAPLLNWLMYFPLEWILSRWTDVLITINQEDYAKARKFPVRGKTVYMPGVGVDVGSFRSSEIEDADRIRNELRLDGSEFVALSVAELNRNKNHEQFIHAVFELRRQNVPIVGLIAGIGNREAELKALVKSLGLEAGIRFLGFRRDIASLMQASDAVVLMSKREGLPKVLLEGMAAGKPLVVTDVRGNREVVTHRVNGYRVSYGDVGATAKALYELYNNSSKRAEIADVNSRDAAAYDIRNITDMLDRVYAATIA